MQTPKRLLTQQEAINIFFVTADEGTTIDDVMKPTYWAHVCRQLKPFHEITVICADGSWRAHLLVRSVGATHANVHKLDYTSFDEAETSSEETPYIAKYRGPSHMHCVVRKDNGAVEKTGFQTANDARAWIMAQMQAMAA